jgi:hypothetical protein
MIMCGVEFAVTKKIRWRCKIMKNEFGKYVYSSLIRVSILVFCVNFLVSEIPVCCVLTY